MQFNIIPTGRSKPVVAYREGVAKGWKPPQQTLAEGRPEWLPKKSRKREILFTGE